MFPGREEAVVPHDCAEEVLLVSYHSRESQLTRCCIFSGSSVSNRAPEVCFSFSLISSWSFAVFSFSFSAIFSNWTVSFA